MNGYLLDTDTLSLLQFGHPVVLQRVSAHPDAILFNSVISLQEQMKGWLGRLGKKRTPVEVVAWYDSLVQRIFPAWKRFSLLSFSHPAHVRFEHLRSLRLNVGPNDLRIAAIALEAQLTVVTRNLRRLRPSARSDSGGLVGLTISELLSALFFVFWHG